MKTNHNGANASTTEELIVQYLDGELVRKELETVLFDRLARSEDARILLREYLVVRGAIRMTREDERFQLSDELDERTRTRIEQMFEALESEPAHAETTGFLPDRAAVASSPVTRRMNLWPRRFAYSAVGLLLLIGAWFAGQREAVHHSAQPSIAQSSVPASTEPQQASVLPIDPATTEPASNPVVEKAHQVAQTQKRTRPAPTPSASGTMASAPAVNSQPTTAAPAPDQNDVMLSQRFAKAINSAKNEVVVTSRDRL